MGLVALFAAACGGSQAADFVPAVTPEPTTAAVPFCDQDGVAVPCSETTTTTAAPTSTTTSTTVSFSIAAEDRPYGWVEQFADEGSPEAEVETAFWDSNTAFYDALFLADPGGRPQPELYASSDSVADGALDGPLSNLEGFVERGWYIDPDETLWSFRIMSIEFTTSTEATVDLCQVEGPVVRLDPEGDLVANTIRTLEKDVLAENRNGRWIIVSKPSPRTQEAGIGECMGGMTSLRVLGE